MELSPEQFSNAFNAAPRPVRSFIVDGKLDAAVNEIVKARGLHVDVAGTLENAASAMLIGIMAPAQVLGELVLAGVDAESAKGILEDLNKKIFVPVRDKVRHFEETGEDLISPPEEDEDVSTPPVAAPMVEAAPDVSSVVPAVPPPAPLAELLVTSPVLPPVPVVPTTVVAETTVSLPPVPVPPPPVPQLVRAPEVPPRPPVLLVEHPAAHAPEPIVAAMASSDVHPAMRTMATDMQVAKEHPASEEFFSHGQAMPTTSSPVVSTTPPAQMAAPPSAAPSQPRPQPPPPANLPGAPRIAPVKEYSGDPYREAIE